MSVSKSRAHQKAVGKFNYLLQGYLDDKRCEVYVAPFDVRLLDHKKSTADRDVFTVVKPDVCVICDISKLDEKGCLGSPDLIIEVLSPGTQKKDYDDKFELYAFNGVKEYWIVAPNDDLVSVYDLDDNSTYQFRKTYIRSEVVPSKVLVDFKCDLDRVFSAKN